MRAPAGRAGRWLGLALGVLVLLHDPAWAYFHHASKVRFVEHSPEAFETARREGKPVFLLISAVWCYWCKYFDRQALDTEEVSLYLNRHYVSIFVDHDRRMDLTRKYVRGLPMIVLFGPDGRVRQSFAGALKKEDFLGVLRRVEAEARADLAKGPPAPPAPEQVAPPAPRPVTPETSLELRRALKKYLEEHTDVVHGGFGTGDKHPHPRLLGYLLERPDVTGDQRSLALVEKSLDGILRGIYDPVDGGFFHYAEGRQWRQPHYEKMAHLNALLALVFDRAYRLTRNPRYREAADATVAYLFKTLYDPKGGGFYGSQTADPDYYRLPPPERRAATRAKGTATRPPVNRDKVIPWNAEAAMAFLALGQSTGRTDLTAAAIGTLEFLRKNCLTDKGMVHFYDVEAGRGSLLGQLEANAWAALAFLEGYEASRADVYREAAERVLAYARVALFEPTRGAFVEQGHAPSDANGVMALALLKAHRLTGHAPYLETAKRVLAALSSEVRAVLVEDEEASSAGRVDAFVFYLRAYERVAVGR